MAPRASETRPILCAVLDADALGSDPTDIAADLFTAGVDWIQLRDRRLGAAALLTLARCLVTAAERVAQAPGREAGDPPRVIVNRRLDVVRASGADGVHLGFDALAAEDARALLGPDRLIGLSLHSSAEATELAEAVDYAHLAPIWNPRSKPATRPPLGLERLAKACECGVPILAQGGLDPDRATQAVTAGAAGIAVTGALTRPDHAAMMASALRRALDGASRPQPPKPAASG
jgi:thiamine-phosphate pyrophosphorylase